MYEGIPRTPRDAVTTAVGLAVLGIQRMQVRQRDLRREVKVQFPTYARRLDEVAGLAEERLEPILSDLEGRLSPSGRELTEQGRSMLNEARRRLRSWAEPGDGRAS